MVCKKSNTSKSNVEAEGNGRSGEVGDIYSDLSPENEKDDDGKENETSEQVRHDCRWSHFRLAEHVLKNKTVSKI